MDVPIDFYCQPEFRTVEIQDITADTELSPKSETVELIILEETLKPSFRQSGFTTELLAKNLVRMKVIQTRHWFKRDPSHLSRLAAFPVSVKRSSTVAHLRNFTFASETVRKGQLGGKLA